MENKTEFKKGDEVVTIIYNPYHGIEVTETTIKNITPKGKIKTNDNSSFNCDGVYDTLDKWSRIEGYVLHNNQVAQNLIKGYETVRNTSKVLEILANTVAKIPSKIYNTRQCDTEKLESIKNRLDEIKKELEDMVGNK